MLCVCYVNAYAHELVCAHICVWHIFHTRPGRRVAAVDGGGVGTILPVEAPELCEIEVWTHVFTRVMVMTLCAY